MQSTNKKLRALYEHIIAKEKMEIHLKNIDRLILQKEEALKIAEGYLQKEEMDVHRLEKQSLYAIFKSILGNKEQELEKERQEYLQAFLKKKSIEECLQDLKKEKEILLHNYSGKYKIEKAFDQLLEKQKKIIKKEDPKMAKAIIHFEERIANHRSRIKEIQQAVREGKKAIRVFQGILLSLERVDIWGRSYSASVTGKRAREKDKIQRGMNRAQKYLQHFEKELFDLSDHYGHDYTHQIDEIKNFIDQFLDSLITDWVIKRKIEHSANIVSNLVDKLTRIVSMLESDVKKTREYITLEKIDQRRIILEG